MTRFQSGGLIERPQCSSEEARTITDQIKVAVEGAWHLITRAYETRAWSALGYSSWDDYCTREFGTSRLRLPREERQEVVASLRESGLSIRAISTATGLGDGTVRRALEATAPNGAVEQPEVVTGVNGKTYAVKDRIETATSKHPKQPPSPKSREGMALKIARATEMAGAGFTSHQIADELGYSGVDTFKAFCKDQGIVVPADAVIRQTLQPDSNRIMEALVQAASDVTAGHELVDYSELDSSRLEDWVVSLTFAITSLTTVKRKIKEQTQ